MRSVERELKAVISEADMLDHDTLGQYQMLCSMLKDTLNISVATIKYLDKLDEFKAKKIVGNIIERLSKAYNLCVELDVALAHYNKKKSSSVANEATKKKRKKRKTDEDYLVMLTEFYNKGDLADSEDNVDQVEDK